MCCVSILPFQTLQQHPLQIERHVVSKSINHLQKRFIMSCAVNLLDLY